MKARIISIDKFTDPRGSLLVGEYPKSLPFSPVRFFIVNGVSEGESRGNHAHKSTEQLLFCLTGHVKVKVNDGSEHREFDLKPGTDGLHIPALHCGEQIYLDPESSLLVLASEPYSADEYINTLSEFNTLTKI